MAEQILPGIYRIEIPLPGSPLKALNAYVLKSPDRFLIIDTGWNRDECLRSMLSGLQELKVNLSKTDFFITHLHADHIGLVEKLMLGTSKVYLGEIDASVAISIRTRTKERLDRLYRMHPSHGFPKAELRRAVENHPGFHYGSPLPFDFNILRGEDILELGNYSFQCIETPGQSLGHMCLYEARKKILFAGDHILFDITPNITRWPEMENPLEKYLSSLEKVYSLDVKLLLPGHRRLMNNHRARSEELREHHKKRLNEAIHALELGEKTAWEVAPHLSWNIHSNAWERFPSIQEWFALGETIAHLEYLEACGCTMSRVHKKKLMFSLRSAIDGGKSTLLGDLQELGVAKTEGHSKKTQKQTTQPERSRRSHAFGNHTKRDRTEGHDSKGHHSHAYDAASHFRRGVKLHQGHIEGHKHPAH
jgi:glyoxylase-like metal-dependent hydrolase (beta-lactamase superfamily II)